MLPGLLLAAAAIAEAPPNIVLLLADDLGYSDIAPFGGEIHTPTLSALAETGIRFSNFHTAASCAPSRAMLLTGVDSHRNGVPNIPEALPPEQRRFAHYQGVLARNVVTVATLLRDSGYHTYLSGKWHLGKAPDQLPSQRGFERTVAMADTGADNWEQKPYLPIYEQANWFADGEALTLPDDFYSSRYLIDRMIEFIDANRHDGAPFFAYVPFMAVHMPVQAPQGFIDRYAGAYDAGWTALREQRRASLIRLGLIPENTAMAPMRSNADWQALTPEQRRYQAKRMAVYAGMVEAMDFHIGRLLAYLRASDQIDNTIFIFTSDNGAEPSGPANPESFLNRLGLRLMSYSADYATLGQQGSFNTIGASFASAAVAPLDYYKFYAGEGGMRVPLILSGAPLSPVREHSSAFSFVTDMAPTILELAGVARTDGYHGGRAVEPMVGRSLLPVIDGRAERLYGDDEPVGYELAGNAALFLGDHKIVLNRDAAGDIRWRLFDIVRDPGEAHDLSAIEPERLHQMLSLYAAYVRDNGVLPVADDYRQQRQVALNGLRDRLGKPVMLALLALAVLTPFYLFARNRRRIR